MTLSVKASVACLCLPALLMAQSAPAARRQPAFTPEDGVVVSGKYTNAFFGFALPIPEDASLRDLTMPSKGLRRFLFGVQAEKNGATALAISAIQTSAKPADYARKASPGPKDHSARRIEIGGKEFWTSQWQEKGQGGKMRSLRYVTGVNGYVLEFYVLAFDFRLAEQLQRSIESITFFEPEKPGK